VRLKIKQNPLPEGRFAGEQRVNFVGTKEESEFSCFLACWWMTKATRQQSERKTRAKQQTRENLFNVKLCCVAARFNIKRNKIFTTKSVGFWLIALTLRCGIASAENHHRHPTEGNDHPTEGNVRLTPPRELFKDTPAREMFAKYFLTSPTNQSK